MIDVVLSVPSWPTLVNRDTVRSAGKAEGGVVCARCASILAAVRQEKEAKRKDSSQKVAAWCIPVS